MKQNLPSSHTKPFQYYLKETAYHVKYHTYDSWEIFGTKSFAELLQFAYVHISFFNIE